MPEEFDWSKCEDVESVPGRLSGTWVIKGTRVPTQAVVLSRPCSHPSGPLALGSAAPPPRKPVVMAQRLDVLQCRIEPLYLKRVFTKSEEGWHRCGAIGPDPIQHINRFFCQSKLGACLMIAFKNNDKARHGRGNPIRSRILRACCWRPANRNQTTPATISFWAFGSLKASTRSDAAFVGSIAISAKTARVRITRWESSRRMLR
jgi:hypothetical protein